MESFFECTECLFNVASIFNMRFLVSFSAGDERFGKRSQKMG